MPMVRSLRSMRRATLVGEHSDVTWKLSNNNLLLASRSTAGVEMSEP